MLTLLPGQARRSLSSSDSFHPVVKDQIFGNLTSTRLHTQVNNIYIFIRSKKEQHARKQTIKSNSK